MVIAVRVITITALLLALNLLTLGNQQDSLRELIRSTQDEDEQRMLFLELSKSSSQEKFEALKKAENSFKTNSNNSVGIETYLQFGNYYLSVGQSDSAVFYMEKALHLSELLNDRFYLARSNQELGKYYLKTENFQKAREFSLVARDIYSAMKDTFWLLQQMNFFADLEIAEGNISKAERIFNDVLRKGILSRDKEAFVNANYGLGNIYFSRNKFEDAFQSFKNSKELIKESANSLMVARIDNKLGAIYLDIGLDSLAFRSLNNALQLNKENDLEILAETKLYLANCYLKSNDTGQAFNTADEAIESAKVAGNSYIYLLGNIKKAEILYHENDLTESKILLEEIQEEIEGQNNSLLKAEYYEIYSSILYKTGNVNEAASAGAIAYEESRNSGNHKLMQKSAFTLGQVMNERGQFISASRFLLLSNQFKDSLAVAQNNDRFMNRIYQFEQVRNLSLSEANTKQAKSRNSIFRKGEANSRVQNLLLISIVLLVILISFFSILVFKGYKSSRQLYNDLKPSKSIAGKDDELEKLAVLNNKIFSVISHDLRSPIISIKDSIDFLRQEELDEETKQEALILSEELAEATLNLLDNLLGWAKNQKKKVDPKKVQVKILDEIKQIEYLYKASILKKEINFTINCDDDIIALADNELINLALRNLVSNAVKFTPRGGSIHVGGTQFENKVLISVKDTGIGISKEDQEKILSPDLFFTKNGTENESGSGIGLKLVNEFVKIMGGELKIESSPGQGSKFLFTLPAVMAKKNLKAAEHVFKHTIN